METLRDRRYRCGSPDEEGIVDLTASDAVAVLDRKPGSQCEVRRCEEHGRVHGGGPTGKGISIFHDMTKPDGSLRSFGIE